MSLLMHLEPTDKWGYPHRITVVAFYKSLALFSGFDSLVATLKPQCPVESLSDHAILLLKVLKWSPCPSEYGLRLYSILEGPIWFGHSFLSDFLSSLFPVDLSWSHQHSWSPYNRPGLPQLLLQHPSKDDPGISVSPRDLFMGSKWSRSSLGSLP